MLTIYVDGVLPSFCIIPADIGRGGVTVSSLYTWAQEVLPVTKDDIYFTYNGKKLLVDDHISDGVVRVVPRLLGGKGGFGSMLRAIGAQIEKTTNREACRDLSGRRLRDINEEKRLKSWISKKADREREALERKQKKLEKLRSEPKIEFKDKKYEEERTKLTEVVHDAVEKGFQASTSNASSSGAVKKPATRKGFMFEEEEFSDDSVDSSDEQSESEEKSLKRKAPSDSDEPSPAKRNHAIEDESSDASSDSSNEKREPDKTTKMQIV